jgi:hypothetical protein
MIGTMQAEHRSPVNRCRFEDASLRGPATDGEGTLFLIQGDGF